jgi:uncharacterized membrane protein
MATNLSVCTYPTPDAAQRAQQVFERYPRPLLSVYDLAVASWPSARRRPITWQARIGGGQHALSGAFWGLLFGLAFLLPTSHTDDTGDQTNSEELDNSLSHLGLSKEFIQCLRSNIVPDSSALFVLAPASLDEAVTRALPTAQMPAIATLTTEQEDRLRTAFADDD